MRRVTALGRLTLVHRFALPRTLGAARRVVALAVAADGQRIAVGVARASSDAGDELDERVIVIEVRGATTPHDAIDDELSQSASQSASVSGVTTPRRRGLLSLLKK